MKCLVPYVQNQTRMNQFVCNKKTKLTKTNNSPGTPECTFQYPSPRIFQSWCWSPSPFKVVRPAVAPRRNPRARASAASESHVEKIWMAQRRWQPWFKKGRSGGSPTKYEDTFIYIYTYCIFIVYLCIFIVCLLYFLYIYCIFIVYLLYIIQKQKQKKR